MGGRCGHGRMGMGMVESRGPGPKDHKRISPQYDSELNVGTLTCQSLRLLGGHPHELTTQNWVLQEHPAMYHVLDDFWATVLVGGQ